MPQQTRRQETGPVELVHERSGTSAEWCPQAYCRWLPCRERLCGRPKAPQEPSRSLGLSSVQQGTDLRRLHQKQCPQHLPAACCAGVGTPHPAPSGPCSLQSPRCQAARRTHQTVFPSRRATQRSQTHPQPWSWCRRVGLENLRTLCLRG